MTLKTMLSPITPLTFGAMSLGFAPVEQFQDNIRVARTAMDAGLWFHTSQEYGGGGAFMILRHAFDEDRAHLPKIIFKIRCDNAAVLRFDVEDALRRLDIERVDIAQLCRSQHDRRPVVDDVLAHGPMFETCQALHKEGKVGDFVLEIFSTFSADAQRAVEHDLFAGYIFYYSVIERQTSNALNQALQRSESPLLSLRTVGGGMLNTGRIESMLSGSPESVEAKRFEELRPLFERSGCASWLEFSYRFVHSLPTIRTTIAGTRTLEHLKELIRLSEIRTPLDPEIVKEIQKLHDRWFGD